MDQSLPRFRVIEGDAASTRPKATIRRNGAKNITIEKFECAPCSDKARHPYGTLIQARIGAHIVDGKLVGGALFWCCRRCERPYFFIRNFPPAK